MEVLFFLLFIANVNVARSNDNVAMESYQETYKIYPDAKDVQDQALGKDSVESAKEIRDGKGENQFQINVQQLKYPVDRYSQGPQDGHQQIHQQIVLPNDSGHRTIVLTGIHGVHPGSHLVYVHPQQQTYAHQTHPPTQILGAAHLQRINEDHGHQKATGYSSYVEHLSKKEDEEIQSALQEGSVDDIKRLVPKSGISFKIYHTGEGTNEHAIDQTAGTHPDYLVLSNQGKQEDNLHGSGPHHKLKVEVPAVPVHIHAFQHQPISHSVESHQLYVQNEAPNQYHHLGHQSVQVIDAHPQGSQDVDDKGTYYTQIQGSSPEPPTAEVSGKSSVAVEPHYNVKIQSGDSGKPTSTAEFNKHVNSIPGSKVIKSKEGIRKEITKFQYKKPLGYPTGFAKPETTLKKTIKHMSVGVKPAEVAHHDSNSHADAEAGKSGLSSFVSHSTVNPAVSIEAGKSAHGALLSLSTAAPHVEAFKSTFLSHSTAVPYVSIEAGKSGYGALTSHTTASPQLNVEAFKNSQSGFITHSTASPYVSVETEKGGHGVLVSHTTALPHVSVEFGKLDHGKFLSHTTAGPHVSVEVPKNNPTSFISHSTTTPYAGLDSTKTQASNLVSHPYEVAKTGQSHFIQVLDAQPYLETEILKTHVPTSSANVEYGLKLTAHEVQNTHIDAEGAKVGQDNFDHQKALEGSTSFDIKNAIGNAEALALGPLHVDLANHPLPYLLPKVPVSLVGNQIPETSSVQGHPHQNIGTHEFLYPAVSLPIVAEVNGKYFRQPQTIPVWTSDHIKHGNVLTANDLHQPLIRLHLPKEEAHHDSHSAHNSHLKKPATVYHHEPQYVRHPQDVHFQPQKLPQVHGLRGNHFKLLPMSTPDWNFYKTQMPNLSLNTVLVKPELYAQESGKQIIPILVKKRKNRSNKDVGVIYGKVNEGRGPVNPIHRREKNLGGNLLQESSNQVQSFDVKGNTKNEFSVSASYKVDRSLRNVDES